MDRKKILFVEEPIYPKGGGQISLEIIVNNLDRNKYEPVSFTVGVDAKNSYFGLFTSLNNLLQKKNIDIIHSNAGSSRASFIAVLLARFYAIPFIFHVRVGVSSRIREELLGLLSEKVIVVSEAVRQKFKNPIVKRKAVKVFNAVDTEKFNSGTDRDYLYDELNIARHKKIIGIFSRLVRWKGHKLFLDAAKEIEKNIVDVGFLIVGGGDDNYKNELISYKQQLGIRSNVIFTGFREDIPNLMNLCDVIVHSSIKPEGFGRTIIEAMACGRPVVATNLGGPPEIIKNMFSGIIVEANPEAIAQQVCSLVGDANLQREISRNALRKIQKDFTIAQHIQRIEAIYDAIAK